MLSQIEHATFCNVGLCPAQTAQPDWKQGVYAPMKLFFQEREKFGPRARVVLERAQQTRSFHDRVLLLDSAHHHAQMFRLHDYSDAVGLETFHERLGNLRGEIFLNLQTPRKNIDNACDFRQTDHFSVRNIRYVRASDERQQMMLAQGV